MSYSRRSTILPNYDFYHQSSDFSSAPTAVLYSNTAAYDPTSAFMGIDAQWLRKRGYDTTKRILDVLLSVLFLGLFSPIMLLAAAAILIEDGGPIVFRQTRIGRDGRPFRMLKFRTLRVSGFDEHDPNASIERRALHIGRFLRKTHLDEVLQFFNVITGSMSIVGPRPEMPFYHDRAASMIPAYVRRLIVKPGITGWAQTNYRHTSSIDEYRVKTGFDLYYVRNRSLSLDLRILVKTASTLFITSDAR